jgi:SAM-dependent methyltransferase
MDNSSPYVTRLVENYSQYRPGYPQAAIVDLLQRECDLTPQAIIADIGSGTGLLTEVFLRNGNQVFGIEPLPAMRTAAEHFLQRYPRFTSIAATAEATTLADHCVDVVTAGQAFHWFDRKRARREFARILVPRGWVVLAWNDQRTTATPFLVAWEQFWQTYLAREGVNPQQRQQELLAPFFGTGTFTVKLFENPLVCDFAALKGRVLSSGNAPTADHPRYPEMLQALEAIFQAHQVNGTVTIEHDTLVCYGQLSKRSR